MAWLWVVLAALLVIGPVAYLMPSKRDRRLAALRTRARLEGGVVSIEHLPKLDAEAHERVSAGGEVRSPTVMLARYALAGGRVLKDVPEVQIMRHPDGRWRQDERQVRADSAWVDLLAQTAAALPEDTLAVSVSPQDVGMSWLESSPADEAVVTAVYATLKGLKTAAAKMAEPSGDDGMP